MALIRPKLGRMKVASISFADVDALHRGLSETTPYQANRVVTLVSKMFALSIKWDMRTDNPARGIERNGEDKRRRYMKGDELARLTQALAGHRDQQAANIVRCCC